jgi:lysine/ornithine N-monooxygenase
MINQNIKDDGLSKEFVIIGFGGSGIAAAIELSKKNISFIVLEKRNTYGGCWNDALDTSSLQTHKDCYKFNDIDYDKTVSNFPNKQEILNYFMKSIIKYDLESKVIYNSDPSITKNKPNSKYLWKVIIDHNTVYCNHILFCVGTNYKPKIPKLSSSINFTNNQTINNKMTSIHSNDFNNFLQRYPNYFNSKRKIVIIGNGASCCDILKKIKISKEYLNHEIQILYNSNKYYLPKHIFGIPCHYFLSTPLIYFFEKVSLKINLVLLTLANMIFINNYLDIPFNKINSYNIVASLIIQEMIKDGILSYHRETLEKIYSDKQLIKTNEGIYTDIDIVLFATGYSEVDMKQEFDIVNTDLLYNYVIPIKICDTLQNINIEPNVGIIGANRTYNFLLNSQIRTKWYIENVFLKNTLNNDEIINWIEKIRERKKRNNLKFLDSTYELFEIVYK